MPADNNYTETDAGGLTAAEVDELLAQVAAQAAAFGGPQEVKLPFEHAMTPLAGPPAPKPAKITKLPKPPLAPKKLTPAPPEREVPGSLLSPRQRRKLQLHHEGFAAALAARLSPFLRGEFTLTLAGIQTLPYQEMTQNWSEPAHLTLFKTEPLRGVAILKIPARMGLCMVDRLMGGPGQPGDTEHEMSAIENALLEQVAQLAAAEWCGHCAAYKDLKPVLLGHESNARFLQTAAPQAGMLLVSLDSSLGECREQIQMGFPFAALEPLIAQLAQNTELDTEPAAAPAPPPARRWNARFDDVKIAVSAEWQGTEVTAREVLQLRVGDVLRMETPSSERVQVRLGDGAKFQGRLGAVAGKWAVELTEVVKH